MEKYKTAFDGYFAGRTVLVTGHTGFKGSWLAIWLSILGAKVVGYAIAPPSEPSHFQTARLAERITHIEGDVRDFDKLTRVFQEYRPSVVFHLAAQAIVWEGYVRRRYTFETNFMGTVNVLEAASKAEAEVVVSITSDKCYENQEWLWGYRETDTLGGYDPYSASKAAAEIALNVYRSPKFWGSVQIHRPRIASGRAGNVIGGGDWGADRLIPDVVRAFADGSQVVLRNPTSTRPWQHVLEAISGYMTLAWKLGTSEDFEDHIQSYNFGPPVSGPGVPVLDVVNIIKKEWVNTKSEVIVKPADAIESGLLQLDSTRAHTELGWYPTWPLHKTLSQIARWYGTYYNDPSSNMYDVTAEQIAEYSSDAAKRAQVWI